MSLTPEQIAERRNAIFASDMVAILNGRIHDVIAEKKYGLVSGKTTRAMQLGNLAEPGLAAWAANELGGVELEGPNIVVRDEAHFMGAHLDYRVLKGNEHAKEGTIIECKHVCEWSPQEDEYAEGRIPDSVYVQVQHQLACGSNCGVARVAAWVVDSMQLHPVPVDEAFIGGLRELSSRVWRDFVVGTFKPGAEFAEGNCASLGVLKRIVREPKTITVGNEAARIIEDWERAKAAQNTLRQLGAVAELHEARAWDLFDNAERIQLPDGRIFELKETKRAGYEVGPSSFRQLKEVKTKRIEREDDGR